MMKTFRHSFSEHHGEHHGELSRFGSEAAHLAHRFREGTVGFARRIGPRRGVLGVLGLAAVIGGGMALARYIKARKAQRLATARSH